MNAHQS